MTDHLKLLAVFAHPADESMGMGGTLAKYAAEGVATHLVCATRGERGRFGPEEQNPAPGPLGQIRTRELPRLQSRERRAQGRNGLVGRFALIYRHSVFYR